MVLQCMVNWVLKSETNKLIRKLKYIRVHSRSRKNLVKYLKQLQQVFEVNLTLFCQGQSL